MPDWSFDPTCDGKAKYEKKGDALQVLSRILKRKSTTLTPRGRGKLMIYECSRCGSYHIGSLAFRKKWRHD